MSFARAGLVALCLVGACSIEEHPPAQSTSTRTADSTRIVTALHAYYHDFSARDWEAFAAHFWPGADITSVWQTPADTAPRVVVTPVPDFVAQAPLGPGSREIFEERPLRIDVRLTGNLAHAWVRYRARFGDAGDVAEWEGTDAFTLMRLGGVWKIVELAFAADVAGS